MKNIIYKSLKIWIVGVIILTILYAICLCCSEDKSIINDLQLSYTDNLLRTNYLQAITPKYPSLPPPLYNFSGTTAPQAIKLEDIIKY